MCGSQEITTHSRNRRRQVRFRALYSESKRARLFRLVAVLLSGLLLRQPARAQTNGPVRISLDEAIQMALQHNHNLLAARTTIQESEADEKTANVRPNP